MKSISLIAAINFTLLLGSILFLSGIEVPENEAVFYLPVIILTGINFIIGAVFGYKGLHSQAKRFILNGLVVLIIGGSSCVTIKFKTKKKEPKPAKKELKAKEVKSGK